MKAMLPTEGTQKGRTWQGSAQRGGAEQGLGGVCQSMQACLQARLLDPRVFVCLEHRLRLAALAPCVRVNATVHRRPLLQQGKARLACGTAKRLPAFPRPSTGHLARLGVSSQEKSFSPRGVHCHACPCVRPPSTRACCPAPS